MKNELFSRTAPVSEQAAAWFFAFESGEVDETGRRRFVDWLKSAPIHIQEFLSISALHLEVLQSPRLAATIDELVSEVRANVVVLDEAAIDAEPAAGKSTPRRALWAVAAIVVLALAATLSFVLAPGSADQVFQTARGEQRSIALDDGSVIVLNTLSEIRIEYTSSSRRTVLVSGEALFDVEEDPDRPFTVDAGPLAITVTGTRFNVYRQEIRTVLTVVEGEVEAAPVDPSGNPTLPETTSNRPSPEENNVALSEPVIVTAGERLAATTGGDLVRDVNANLERATAWTQRRLVFDNETLDRVSEEFNRYNHRHLVIEDSSLAGRRITGVFNAHDTDALVAFLEGQPGIRVHREPDAIRVAGAQVIVE